MPDFDLTITICSWNACDDLRTCLQHLRDLSGEARFEVIIVENNSEDGSGEMAEKEFPEFRLLKQTQNLGFTGGHNLAIREGKGRHILLLNSDAFMHEGSIRTLMKFIHEHPDAGILGPKLLNGDGTLQYSCRRFPNPMAALFRNTLLGRFFPNTKSVGDYLMKEFDHEAVITVDWVSGAALLVTEEALKKLKGLDPSYYMFCEDVDICWRAWEEGFKVYYVPQSVVTHLIGRSTDKAPNRMIWRFHKSMLLFYRKHQVPKLPVLVRPFAVGGAACALSLRAGAFFVKNRLDVLKRKWAR